MSDGGSVPGWYGDPGQHGWLRWWDGRAWTGFAMPNPRTAADRSYPEERRFLVWARLVVLLNPVFAAVAALGGVLAGPSYRRLIDWYRSVLHNVGTPGYQAPPVPRLSPYVYLGFVAVVPIVGFVLWQYRAATTARDLGYPAWRSPGFGVGSWFIPVVNFWMPAQALMGCLPTGHRLRARVPYFWALYLVGGTIAGLTTLASASSRTAGWVLLAVAVAVQIVVAVGALALVVAVDECHRPASAGDAPQT